MVNGKWGRSPLKIWGASFIAAEGSVPLQIPPRHFVVLSRPASGGAQERI